jgi:hypothetical protein
MMLSIGNVSPGSVNAPTTKMTNVASAKKPTTNFHGKRAGTAFENEPGPKWPLVDDVADIGTRSPTPEPLIVSS